MTFDFAGLSYHICSSFEEIQNIEIRAVTIAEFNMIIAGGGDYISQTHLWLCLLRVLSLFKQINWSKKYIYISAT